MAVLSDNNLTLADRAKHLDPKGRPAAFARLLTKTDMFWDYLATMPSNGGTKHSLTVETSLPEIGYRGYNEGSTASKGTLAQFEEGMSMLESRTEVDVELAKVQSMKEHLMAVQADMKMRAFRYTQATTFFYGNAAVNKKAFNGLSVRYANHTNAGNSDNVLTCGGSGADNTSIWLISSSPETFYSIFPEGSAAGLQQQNLGEQRVTKPDGSAMQAYCELYKWNFGLALQDWRHVVRICNIDVSDLQTLSGTQAASALATNIWNQMHEAFYRIPGGGAGTRMMFAMNRTCHAALSRLNGEKNSGALDYGKSLSAFGTPRQYSTFMGIPIALTDSLINTEAAVAA